jgi:hypothetical protein
MATEQQLITQWRSLPSPPPKARPQFQQFRDQIVAAGIPLLTGDEIEQEVTELRGGYQELTVPENLSL